MIRQDFTSMLVLHNAHLIQFTTSHSLWLSSNRWQIFIKYRIIGVYTLKIFTRHSYEINRLGGGGGPISYPYMYIITYNSGYYDGIRYLSGFCCRLFLPFFGGLSTLCFQFSAHYQSKSFSITLFHVYFFFCFVHELFGLAICGATSFLFRFRRCYLCNVNLF